MSTPQSPPTSFPPPRSWKNRGRMPEARRERLAELAAAAGFADPAAAAAWAPQVLDVGFGLGASLLAAAQQWPAARVLGVEVHQPGILRALDALVAAGHTERVRVLHGDVTGLLPLLGDGSLLAVRAYFPDPWPKRRHADRRLFGPAVVAALARRLGPGATLHVVTDDATYAAGVRAAAAAVPELVPVCGGLGVPDTKYARRAAAAGRTAQDLAWRKGN